MKNRVAVLGASPNRERYSNQAVRMLIDEGYEVLPINPGQRQIEGIAAYPRLAAVEGPVHTVSVYVSPKHACTYEADIVALNPPRVIFNPGAEYPPLMAKLSEQGVEVLAACTLVMLRTGQFTPNTRQGE